MFACTYLKHTDVALKLFFYFHVIQRFRKILPGNFRKFRKFRNFRKFGKMSGSFLRENSGKFSPGFSGIFRGCNYCYSPKFVFLKNKNQRNFGKFREEISGKFWEIFPENVEKFSPNFSAFF